MAILRKVRQEIRDQKVDLAEVLKKLFVAKTGADNKGLNIDQIWFALKGEDSSLRKNFRGGDLVFSITELQETLNKLVKASILEIVLWDCQEDGIRVGFSKTSR